MKSILLITALLAAAAQETPTEVAPVTVTAPRPDRALAALQACMARGCPPREEMVLTLKSAEESFLAGDYRQARSTLQSAIDRNAKHADAHPVLLAGLHKANTTVHQHLGFGDVAARSSRRVPHLLARQYGERSSEVMWARLDEADAVAKAGQLETARTLYRRLRSDLRDVRMPALERVLEVRWAWLYAAEGRIDFARAELKRLAASRDPADAAQAFAAKTLLLRLAVRGDDDAAVERLVSELQGLAAAGPTPVLLWSPPLEIDGQADLTQSTKGTAFVAPSPGDPTGWIDVGYWIGADGRVREPEILRAAPAKQDWHRPALEAVARRVYAPMKLPDESGGRLYRVERVALTALRQRPPTGTRLPTRSSRRDVHTTDLTGAAVAPAAPADPKPR